MSIILSTIFAHVISDFIIQSAKTVDEKNRLKPRGLLKHFFEVLIPLYVVLQLQFNFNDIILYSIAISFIHIILDMVKVLVQLKNAKKFGAGIFIFEQFLHIASTVIIIAVFNIQFNHNNYYNNSIQVLSNTLSNRPNVDIDRIFRLAELYGIIYILFGVGAGIFIGNFVKRFKPENQEEKPLNAGQYIGIFERFVIITLTMLSQFGAIAFIIAAKSLARHEDFNKRGFAEYYLLGTLLSIFIAIVGGLLANYLVPLVNFA